MHAREPTGTEPFDERERGHHLPRPPWIADEEEEPSVAVEGAEEPELDPPHHVHDLWVVLGLGEE